MGDVPPADPLDTSPWDAAMRLIEGPPRGDWDVLGSKRSDFAPGAAEKLAWLQSDARSTNLLCDLLIAVRCGDIRSDPAYSLFEGVLDPFGMKISSADAMAVRATGKVRTKAEAKLVLADLIGRRGAYLFEKPKVASLSAAPDPAPHPASAEADDTLTFVPIEKARGGRKSHQTERIELYNALPAEVRALPEKLWHREILKIKGSSKDAKPPIGFGIQSFRRDKEAGVLG